MIGLIGKMLKQPWCSMMIENAKHQGSDIQQDTRRVTRIRTLVDRTQMWDDTPQGDAYWRSIAYSLGER